MINQQEYVYLNPDTHTYFDREGREYLSVSKFISMFTKKFDREGISKMSAKKQGVSQEEILAIWDKKRDDSIDHGNRIHNNIESFEKTTQVIPGNEDLLPVVLSVAQEYKHYYRSTHEHRVYNSELLLAGTGDRRLQCTSHKNSVIDWADYKTNQSAGITFKSKYNQYLLGPLSHLQDCSYNKYCLQLSIYAWMDQQMTGCKIGSLHIRFFPPNNLIGHYIIPVPYLKLEVEAMMQERKKMLEKKEPIQHHETNETFINLGSVTQF